VAEAANEDFTQLSNKVKKYWKKAHKHILGHIIYSPPITISASNKRYTED